LRHNDNPPQQKSKGKTAEDLVDRQLPELLFHMEELRGKIPSPVLTTFCLPCPM
jgi:NCK-associated protein 1